MKIPAHTVEEMMAFGNHNLVGKNDILILNEAHQGERPSKELLENLKIPSHLHQVLPMLGRVGPSGYCEVLP